MLRVTTEWTGIQGAPYYTATHFGGLTATEAGAAHALMAQIWTAGATFIRNDLTWTVLPEVSLVDEATGDTTATFLETAVSDEGGLPGDDQPTIIQGLIRLRTGVYVGGREIRGRVFLPGQGDTYDDDGVPSASIISGWQGIWNTAISDGQNAGAPLQVYSPTNGQAADVTAASMWNQWAILRSRRD